jgi:hypothetical protein
MRTRHLLAALGAWATLGLINVASVIAQAPNLLPGAEGGTVVSDEAVPHETSHSGAGEHVVGPHAAGPHAAGPHGGPLPSDAAAAQFGGYPYTGAWHAGYQHPMYGQPLALVVPPVSHYQTIYSWGIATTQMPVIYPQYGGPGYGTPWTGANGDYLLPPYWPSDTRQFGVYYIRGPW